MSTAVTISAAGAHASAAATDRIPASKAGVKGYLTLTAIASYLFDTSVTSPLFTTSGSNTTFLGGSLGLYLGASNPINWRSDDSSGAADVVLARVAANTVGLGGATASFPAIGRSTTYLTMPLADGTLPGLIDSEVFATTQVVTALTNNSNAVQNVFAAANDVLTLRPTTTYFFEAQYFINTGTTTHTTATGFVASSAFTSINYFAELWSTTAGTISTTAPSVLDVAVSTATVLNATSIAPRTTIRCRGVIRTNAATTVTPQITFSAGPTGTCEIAVNSFFRAWPVGSNTVASFGNWA